MRKRVWSVLMAMMLAVAPVSGCRSQGKAASVDTTKDVYRDDEAPAFQLYVVNGVEERIPWARVPESQRWLVEWEQDGQHFKHRVPIVRIEISSRDRTGKPVPEKEGYEINGMSYGLNPKYYRHAYYGHAH